MTAPLQRDSRIIHRAHPEYGFGIIRYVEEDAFGDTRLQVSFDHLDLLQTVVPESILFDIADDAKAILRVGTMNDA